MGNGSDEILTRRDIRDLLTKQTAVMDIERFNILRRPYIDGVEVTQGIQYYGAEQHLTNANDRGPDNSVRLVASKPAWARVYVRTGLLGGDTAVTGDLVVERMFGPKFPLWQAVGTLTPQGPSAVTTQRDPDYATERATIGTTLNFIIPADLMWGRVRITARIWPQAAATPTPMASATQTLDVTLLQTLRLRGILIAYNGPTSLAPGAPNLNLAAPTLANMQATAAWTLTTNPVQSQGTFSSAGTLTWGTPLTGLATNPGGCSTQWLTLNAAVAQVRTNDGNRTDVIYYGLLPAGTPIANVGGCESSGVSTGPDTQQVTMAHEVGHGAGLAHGPCGTPGDANYPAYEPYDPANTPMASLGEYGLNINNGVIHVPGEKDYMSYCGPVWISLYHHGRLVNNARFNPQTVGLSKWRPPVLVDPYLWPWEYIPDPPPWERFPGDLRMKAEPVVSIIGIVTNRRDVQVQSVMRVTALPVVADAVASSLSAELVGRDGNVIGKAPVMRLAAHGCGCKAGHASDEDSYTFQALIPTSEAGASLRIVDHGAESGSVELWRRTAPGGQPKIARFDVRVREGMGAAKWEATGSGDAGLEFSLQFSKDKGRSWNGVMVGVRQNECRFPLDSLPSGPVTFRLLAHDGFHSVEAVSKVVGLPRHAPAVAILHPQEGPALTPAQPMRLWAAVSTASSETIDPEQCTWTIDGRVVARGVDAWVTTPKEGVHRCAVTVESEAGRSEAAVTFRTAEPNFADDGPVPSGPGSTPTPRARKAAKAAGAKRATKTSAKKRSAKKGIRRR
jgi:hypothetical protein